jgi:hypothetical protein
MTSVALRASPRPDARDERHSVRPRPGVTVVAGRAATAVVAALAFTAAWTHRHQLGAGVHRLNHLSWWWLPPALIFEAFSLVSFALLQRRLLRAGDTNISAADMTKIAVAANAISGSLPGGAAWAAPWSWKQLRQHGADRRLATWVVLAAGALSSVALFVIVVVGAELAGNHGPVASLRWLAGALAALPVGGGLLMLATRSRRSRRSPSGSRLAGPYEWIRVVRLSPFGWAASLMLALANWLFDLACLIACLAAVGAHVDWRGIVIVYALTQLIAVLPFTPGGLGVVEAGLTALLISYGTPSPSAIATVVVYRALTFWALVPGGWVMWWRLHKARPAIGAPRHRRDEDALLANTQPGRAAGSSRREYEFRPALRPHTAFNAVPALVPAPRTQHQSHQGV